MKSVAGIIRRRGTIVVWEHSIPAGGADVDQDSRAPRLTAGGPRVVSGPHGESYGTAYRVRGYFAHKVTATFAQYYGLLDERTAQLDVACPFAPEPYNEIVLPAPADLAAWNAGQFTQLPATTTLEQDEIDLIARDRFTINDIRYIVKSAAVEIQDKSVTIAWRMLLGADTF